MSKHTKLTKPERVLLSEWKKQGLSNIECGKRLGRDKSTIGRKLKRNKTAPSGFLHSDFLRCGSLRNNVLKEIQNSLK